MKFALNEQFLVYQQCALVRTHRTSSQIITHSSTCAPQKYPPLPPPPTLAAAHLVMASPASLEDLIISKLSSLGLTHDESTASFVQGIIEEESFEPEVRPSLHLPTHA
jgi:hypothetical protein